METVEGLPADLHKLCRTCMNLLQEEPAAQNFFFVGNTVTDLASLYINLTSLQVLPYDGLPNVVCNQCKEYLSFFAEFRERCLKVNNMLYELIHEQLIPDIKIEEDTQQVFLCNEPNNCDYKISDVDFPLINNEINYSEDKKLVNELPHFTVTDPDSSNENSTSYVLQNPTKCSDISEETKCRICSRQYINKFELSLHFLKHAAVEVSLNQDSGNYFFCEFCGELHQEQNELKEHYNLLHTAQEKMYWKCCSCGDKFEDELNLLLHERTENHFENATVENGTFKCLFCDEQYINVSNLLIHSICHLINKYNCNDCQKHFISDDSLHNHLESHGHKIHIKNECENNTNDLSGHVIPDFKESFENSTTSHLRDNVQENQHTTYEIKIEYDYQNNRSEENITAKVYKCTYANCKKFFNNYNDLTSHRCVHLNIKPYECHICKKKFVDSSHLKRHLLIHTGEKPFSCNKCDKRFTRKYRLQQHLVLKHSLNNIQIPTKSYECEICKKKFAESSKLKRHLFIHTGEKPFSCNKCDKKFTRRNMLKQHLVHKHPSPSNSDGLNNIQTAEKPYECENCKRKFVHSSHLKRHLLNYTGEKPYSCNKCDEKFTRKYLLEKHLVCKHSSAEKSEALNNIQTAEKPYECEICKRKFAESSNLKRHLLIHAGEKPYSCNKCDEKFKRKYLLKKHLVRKHSTAEESKGLNKIQTSKKTYKCEFCEKMFSDSSNLKRHMILHTGEMPFSCDKCDQKFRRKEYLKHHVKSKHTEVSESDKPDGS